MEYYLRLAIPGKFNKITITASEYRNLDEARNILISALSIEELYEILINDYLQFENQLFSISTNTMVYENSDYIDVFEARSKLNSCLVNLLSIVRLYLDSLPRRVRKCKPQMDDIEGYIKALKETEFEKDREYRFMEALRNFVQHYELPIHFTSHSMGWTSLDDEGLLEFSMDLASQRSFLGRDGEFKKKVLQELEEKTDLKHATRVYIEALSNIHLAIRKSISGSVQKARNLIQSTHQQHGDASYESLIAYKISSPTESHELPLLLKWDDIRIKLEQKNKKLTNLRKRYVTGAVKRKNK